MKKNFLLLGFFLFYSPVNLYSGSLDSIARPSDPSSAMHTLDDIYNRLNSGIITNKRTGEFSGPLVWPIIEGKNLIEIMDAAPRKNIRGAKPSDVLCGKTFWGINDGSWGRQTGTLNCQ